MKALQIRATINYLRPGADFVVGGDDWYQVIWNGPGAMPSEAEVIAIWPKVREQLAGDAQGIRTAALNKAAIEQKALTALALNDAYLAKSGRTTADAIAQVAVLTRECSAVIRLLLDKLDSTSGT